MHGISGGGPVFVESPPSPLSLMDVVTVGSPVPITGGVDFGENTADTFAASMVSESSSSSLATVASAQQSSVGAMLEQPATERLLPIGQTSTSITRSTMMHGNQNILDSQGRIFDRVWQVFGSMDKSHVDG